jgi:hypothetical protein
MPFLSEIDLRAVTIPAGEFRPLGLALGKGPGALEVLVLESAAEPSVAALRNAWKARLAGRATPLLVVALYDGRAALCGPVGDHPPAMLELPADRVEQVCRVALEEPSRHAALRFLHDVVQDIAGPLFGLGNEGLFAAHELRAGVPRREDWRVATEKSRGLGTKRGRELLTAMGFVVEPLKGPAAVLRAGESRTALAVFLERDESPETANSRFGNVSAVTYALWKADAENLPYVVLSSGPRLRLYTTRTGTATGQPRRAETFLELHLDLLTPEQAGYLWLLFSPDALVKGGSVEAILADSARYAADLGVRLRERVYEQVVPRLAQGLLLARDLRNPTAEQLAETYRMTLLVLFRLLFIAYAEDKNLLPYRNNALYRSRSLKQKANELIEIRKRQLAFDDSTTHWDEVRRLFDAVNTRNAEWDVPAYNGGLFSTARSVSPEGAELETLRLSNRDFGHALTELLTEATEEGWGPVDFRSLSVREFGTIYEGLLENELAVAEEDLAVEARDKTQYYRPAKARDEVKVKRGQVYPRNTSGARKSTGSYFTKHFAVEHLLDNALEPALAKHLETLAKLSDRAAADAFFDFRVADIAMGSGHFLVAAVDRIEKAFSGCLAERPLPQVLNELERLRRSALQALGPLGETIEIKDTQLLRRQIARRCIYGVDLNPTAVQLARLSLWVHTFVPGLPLSFLDHNLVEGNSLVGIATVEEAVEWLKEIVDPLFAMTTEELVGAAREALERLRHISDANAAEIAAAREAFHEAQEAVAPAAALFDVLAAARIDGEVRKQVWGSASHWKDAPEKVLRSEALKLAGEALKAIPPFHFPIAFPEVFLRERPGFDVILGNPPWEKVRVEEHQFWARYSPGLRGLDKPARDALIRQLRRNRPDLVALWEQERTVSEKMRDAVRFLPGMNTGHPDLFRAFTWRFIQLACQTGGRLGVVLPGDAFKIAGNSDVRERLAAACTALSPQMLTNKRGWVFDDVHPQKLIALLSALVSSGRTRTVYKLTPEFHDKNSWDHWSAADAQEVPVEVIRSYSPTLVLPLLPVSKSFDLVELFMQSPRLAEHRALRVRRVYADFETSKHDRAYWHSEKKEGDWPVYAGESFDLWQPDTGSYYAFTDAQTIQRAAHEKWKRAPRGSPYTELPMEWRQNASNHPIFSPRIAFRDVTNRTNTRTLVCALIPPKVVTVQVAPWVLWLDPDHPKTDEAYLLGVMCSLPLDWWCRRFIEGHADQEAFNCLRVPDPRAKPSLSARVVELAGRLACPDARFKTWARAVGAECGPLDEREKEEMIHELDAVVAHLYGLSEERLQHVFETFHEGWDYRERWTKTCLWYREWHRRLSGRNLQTTAN